MTTPPPQNNNNNWFGGKFVITFKRPNKKVSVLSI